MHNSKQIKHMTFRRRKCRVLPTTVLVISVPHLESLRIQIMHVLPVFEMHILYVNICKYQDDTL